MSTNTVLITGATGYIGSQLIKGLAANGYKVHIIVRDSSSLDFIFKDSSQVNIHNYSGTIESMMEILDSSNPEIVIHLASLFLATHTTAELDKLLDSNIRFGLHLLESMCKNGIRKLINTSTSWQHYKGEIYNPVNLYAATKQAFESISEYYIQHYDLALINLALFETYGPHDNRPKIMNLLWDCSEKKMPLLMSPGGQLIDIVYIDDVIKAYLKAIKLIQNMPRGSETYGISSLNPITLKKLVEVFEDTLNVKLPIIWGGREYRKREVMIPWRDFKKLPDWQPRIGLKEGIQLMTFKNIKLNEE